MINTYVIDLFCGAGGVTTSISDSKTNISVIACVNHDKNAIISHAENHPNCLHFTEDIRTIELSPIKELVDRLRKEDPTCKIALWGSLECQSHSKAKGGKPKNEGSRSLANDLMRYYEALNFDFLWIENVREFMQWGPLDDNMMPCKENKGSYYEDWVKEWEALGFSYDYRLLTAADYGAYTIRLRYFGQFSKDASLISWPEPTHSKKPIGGRKRWKPVGEVLNLQNIGQSIFTRKKPLVERTLMRIENGLRKYLAEGKDNFLFSYYNNSSLIGEDDSCGTLTTKDRFAKVSAVYIDNQYGKGYLTKSDEPLGTLTTNPKQSVVTVEKQWILNPQYKSNGSGVQDSCFTLIARMDKAPPYLVSAVESKDFDFTQYKTDSPTMLRIIEIMKEYGLSDIKTRMLEEKEMLKIQGFPENYILKGTVAERKKYIGNSVEVNVGKSLFQAIDANISQKLAV